MSHDIWIWVQQKEGAIEEATLGLIGEARRLLSDQRERGTITAVALGFNLKNELSSFGSYGVDRVLYIEDKALTRYHGELYAKALSKMVNKYQPSFILMAHGSETADLSPRLAALLETGLVTHAMDLKIDERGKAMAIRPVANGYLFEEIHFDCPNPLIISFLPSVLSALEFDMKAEVEIMTEPMDESSHDLKTKVVEVMEAPPGALNLEEADIIVSGGRGAGKGESFEIIHELAKAIKGSVGGTRPVIDSQALSFDRQIGQTGKTVNPRLILTCGISGANEFTAGMEKSRFVIAINTDPRARIFRFADLAVIGDLHEILPILIERINDLMESE
jgi:electron transfer flavoprotein alpha subunit